MPGYHASVLIDGWLKLRIEAKNRADAAAKLRNGRIRFDLLDQNLEVVSEVIDSKDSPTSMFTLDVEEIDLSVPVEDSQYHAAQPA